MRRYCWPLLLLMFAACAALPEVHPWDYGARPTITGAQGALPPARVEAVLAGLSPDGKGASLLERHLAFEESVSGKPLTTGNDVRLLNDGPAACRSMFEAIAAAALPGPAGATRWCASRVRQ